MTVIRQECSWLPRSCSRTSFLMICESAEHCVAETLSNYSISAAARHALTRVPDSFHKLPVWTSLFSLLRAVHLRQHEAVYTGAEELLNLCHQPALSNGKLGVVLAGLATAFVGKGHNTSLSVAMVSN